MLLFRLDALTDDRLARMPFFNVTVKLPPLAFEGEGQSTGADRVRDALDKQAGIGTVTLLLDELASVMTDFRVDVDQYDAGFRLDGPARKRLALLMHPVIRAALFPPPRCAPE